MRVSEFLLPTLRETPADAEIVSHQLMLRAGMISRLAAGLYSWLPLGLRVLRKVERIVREEMDASGAQEVLMPAVQPAELWEETGRWGKFGPQLLKMTDRHQRQFCFGPTHEEVITDLARRHLRSYRDLPANFYQIQTKFRDEIRPRFGVMRAREFLMKDAYSFHLDDTSLDETYRRMHATYCRIFERAGLDYRAVEADTGAIGGRSSHEFHVLADSGEDAIAFSSGGNYAANVELAAAPPAADRPAAGADRGRVATPGVSTIEQVCAALNVSSSQTVKTLLVKGSEASVVALVLRGDHELNPVKAQRHPAVAAPLTFASEAEIRSACGTDAGSIGPAGLEIPVIADFSASVLADFICGANEAGYHLTGVNWGRDLPEPQTADLRLVVTGDPSPAGDGTLQIVRGIEVGHIFALGDTYSRALNATVLDEFGAECALQMGCYGIGVSRIVAAAIEQHHDENGIVWPAAIAPFDIAIVPINFHKSVEVREATEKLYADLRAAGVEVLLDDRAERPGVMFADMDLIGIPHRVVIGAKGLEKGALEYKPRATGKGVDLPLSSAVSELIRRVRPV